MGSAAPASSRPPLLLLDVDGVLNALSDQALASAWAGARSGSARAGGRRWPIRWSPEVVERLRRWHEQGRVELQWLTTWGAEANQELRQLLGMPELRVAGSYDERDPDPGQTRDADVDAHAAVAPSAPDELTGRWWKHDVVRGVQRQHPGRLIVWVDDELFHDSPFRRWAAEQANLVAVGPDPASGLSPADLRRVGDLLAAPGTASGNSVR